MLHRLWSGYFAFISVRLTNEATGETTFLSDLQTVERVTGAGGRILRFDVPCITPDVMAKFTGCVTCFSRNLLRALPLRGSHKLPIAKTAFGRSKSAGEIRIIWRPALSRFQKKPNSKASSHRPLVVGVIAESQRKAAFHLGVSIRTTPCFARRLTGNPDEYRVGAGDETRTRDIFLGKEVLYQLSYTRS